MGLQALGGACLHPVPTEMSLCLQLAWQGTLLQVPGVLLRFSCGVGRCESAVGRSWVGYHGQLLATYSRRIWPLLWLLILVAGASPGPISRCARNESVGSTGESCGRRKSRITDERAVLHQMTRVWTYGAGNSESMDARVFNTTNLICFDRHNPRLQGHGRRHIGGMGVSRRAPG